MSLRMATELSTDNSPQRYKKDLILPNYFDKFHNFCPFSTYKHTLSRYVLLKHNLIQRNSYNQNSAAKVLLFFEIREVLIISCLEINDYYFLLLVEVNDYCLLLHIVVA